MSHPMQAGLDLTLCLCCQHMLLCPVLLYWVMLFATYVILFCKLLACTPAHICCERAVLYQHVCQWRIVISVVAVYHLMPASMYDALACHSQKPLQVWQKSCCGLSAAALPPRYCKTRTYTSGMAMGPGSTWTALASPTGTLG